MLRLKLLFLFVLISLLSMVTLFVQGARGAQVTLAWNASSDTAVTGYKLYWGTQAGQYALLADVGKSVSQVVSDLQSGTSYHFAATAYNAQGVESNYSNEVSYKVPTTTCTYSITPTSKTFAEAGGSGSVGVTTQTGCSWTASSPATWIQITSGASGTGNGTVAYTVSANTGTSSRTASASIAGQIFSISQAGAQTTTTYTITASAGSGGSISPSGSVSVSKGSSKTFTMTPSSGYRLHYLLIDGKRVRGSTTYTFSNIVANHSIAAYFRKK